MAAELTAAKQPPAEPATALPTTAVEVGALRIDPERHVVIVRSSHGCVLASARSASISRR